MTDPNLDKATAFLSALDRRASSFVFQTFTDAPNKPKPDPLARVILATSFNGELLDRYRDGAGIYVTINEVSGNRRVKEAVTRIRAVWCEADHELPDPSVWPLKPSLLIATSLSHFHCYWFVAGDWSADGKGIRDFESVMRCQIENFGNDPNAKDLVRVLRLPGFTNRKRGGEPFMVHACGGSGRRYTRSELVRAFKPSEERREPKCQCVVPALSADETHIRQALEAIPADAAKLNELFPHIGSHLVFIFIGMALHHWDRGRGFALWADWCRQSPEFNEKGLHAQWSRFKSGRDNPITLGTLLHYTKECGRLARVPRPLPSMDFPDLRTQSENRIERSV